MNKNEYFLPVEKGRRGKSYLMKNLIKNIKTRFFLILILLSLGIILLNSLFSPFPIFNTSLITTVSAQQEIEPGNDIHPTCLEQGKELYWEQKYPEAIKQLEQCIPQDPDNPEIYYYIGQSYFQQGQQAAQKKSIIKATKYYREAYQISDTTIEKYFNKIEQNPEQDHTNDYLQLAYIYQIRSLIPGINEYQAAITIYETLLTEKPYLTSVYYNLGWIYYQMKDYQQAVDTFSLYLKPGRKSGFVYYYLGLSYDKIGEKEKAKEYFQLVLDEFPNTEIATFAKKELR